jgi:hypothetical protein
MQEKCENWDMAACLKKFQDSNISGLESKKSHWVPSEIQGNMTNLTTCLKKFQDSNSRKKKSSSVDNEFFVHARHACNDCSMTPIIGTRYHSTKVPDVDLCETCFTKYEGDKLDFMPEIQGMWPFSLRPSFGDRYSPVSSF